MEQATLLMFGIRERCTAIVRCSIFVIVIGSPSLFAGQTYSPYTGRFDLCSTIQEADGSPVNATCPTINVSNGTLTDNGNGTVTLTTGSGAPTTADYLVGTANGSLSAEIVVGTSALDLTNLGNTLVGGSTTTSDLNLKTTSGVGAAGADMHFLVGNNGATEAMTILNSGAIGVRTNAPAAAFHIKDPSTASTIPLIIQSGIDASNEYNEINFRVTADESYGAIRNIISAAGEGSMAFLGSTSGVLTEVMRFEGSGDMFVGVTDGVGKLNVARGGGAGANAPTTLTLSNNYLTLGAGEYNNSSYRIIGFGYQPVNAGVSNNYSPAYIGYQEMAVVSGQTKGDLIFGTRSVTTDTQASERMRILTTGEVGIGDTTPAALLTVGDGDDFQVSTTGAVTTNNTITSSRTTDLGWTVVTGANTACNTSCVNACVFGQDTDTANGPIVGCADATADRCVCAGSS